MGQGRRHRRAVHRAGAAGDRAVPRDGRRLCRAYRLKGEGQAVLVDRPQRRRGIAVGGPVRVIRRPTDIGQFRDGAVLVTEKTDPDWVPIMKQAAGDRHQPRRPHLPRRHRQPRAGPAGHRRHRRRHRSPRATARKSRSPAPRATQGFVYEGSCRSLRPSVDVRDSAGHAHQDHAQCGQPRRRPSAGGALPNDGVGLARMEFIICNLHQGPSDGAGALRPARGPGPPRRDRPADRAATPTRPSTSSTGWPQGVAMIAAALLSRSR